MTPMLSGLRPPVEGLTVVGEAVRDAAPEIIELSFDVHAAGMTAAIASQENATRVTYIGQNLTSMGISQSDLRSSGIEVCPILQLANSPLLPMPPAPMLPAGFGASNAPAPMMPTVFDGPNLIGYRAASSLKVAVRDPNRVGEVVDTVTRGGAIPNGSVRFLLQDETTLERTLLEKAVHRAKDKAAVLAAAVGKSTGNPVSISEEFTAYQPQQFYGTNRLNPLLAAALPGSNVRLPFTHGQLTFCAKVSVVYQLQ
jgi:uncharacterized protein YggE